MDDSTLHVDPTLARGGAGAFSDCGSELAGALQAVAKLHSEVLEVWAGPAASKSETEWAELEERVRTHILRLDHHARSIGTATDEFEGTDDANGQGFRNV